MKNKNIKTTLGASLTALAFSTMLTSVTYAQTCAVVPNCATLGYTKSASECSGLDSLKCPFDQTKYFCTSGGGTTIITPTPPAKEWKGTLVAEPCDFTCGPWYNLIIEYRNIKCKLPAGTVSMSGLGNISIDGKDTDPQLIFDSRNACTDEGYERTYSWGDRYEREKVIGVCNGLADYEFY